MHEVSVSRVIELRDVAEERRGLRRKLLVFEGAEKPSRIRRSNWEAYWLSDEQVQYACVDAFVNFLLGKELQAWDWDRDDD